MKIGRGFTSLLLVVMAVLGLLAFAQSAAAQGLGDLVSILSAAEHAEELEGAALTNVEVSVRVTDTENGAVWERSSPLGEAFQPILDTSAFATCP